MTSTLKPLRVAAIIAVAALVLQVPFLLTVLGMAISALAQMPSPQWLDDPMARVIDLGNVIATVVLLQIPAILITVVAVMVWSYRARLNAEILDTSPEIRGGARQRWSPLWAIFGWIVPIMNFWVPRQMVGDIWRAGAPDRGMRLINAWWTLYLVYALIPNLSRLKPVPLESTGEVSPSQQAMDALKFEMWINLAGSLAGIAAAILAILVIWTITRVQESHADHIARVIAEAANPRPEPEAST